MVTDRAAAGSGQGNNVHSAVRAQARGRHVMVTSNRPLEKWGKLLGDVPSATAILDRFLADSEVFQLTGRSYRLDKSRKNSNSTKAQTWSASEEK